MSNYNQSENAKSHLISLSTRFNKPFEHKTLLLLLNKKPSKAQVDIEFGKLTEKERVGSKNNCETENINLELNKNINYKTLEELKPISKGITYFYELKKLVDNNSKLEAIKLFKRIMFLKLWTNSDVLKLNKKDKQHTKVVKQIKEWENEWKD